MEKRYMRNVPALTNQQQELLRTKKAAVIGCGGLGGYLIEYLCRIGIGEIRVVDGDVFEETNLNRQLLSDTAVLGKSKALCAADRIKSVNPEVRAEAFPVFLTEENGTRLVSGCDVVLDALDSISARKILAEVCGREGVPLVYGAISGWVAQAAVSMPGDGIMDKLYPAETQLRDKSVLSFTPALCASLQAALCVKLLTGQPVETGTLYYFDLLNQEFEAIPMTE